MTHLMFGAVVALILVVVSSDLQVAAAFQFPSCYHCDASNRCTPLKSTQYTSINGDEDNRHHDDDIDPIRRRRQRNLEYWGVEHIDTAAAVAPSFPSSLEDLADEVFHSITGTIYGLQRPDPNIASNAMHQSVLDYRPTQPAWASKRRFYDYEMESTKSKRSVKTEKKIPARIGIEIDGAAHLTDKLRDEGRAMRMVSLQIAHRLSTQTWDSMESTSEPRSVALYYNSMEQSLLASRELSRMKNEKGMNNIDDGSFDSIFIRSLGQDTLPSSMVKEKGAARQKKSKNDNNANTNPGESIIVIVKPTDYDSNSLIPVHGGGEGQPTIQANVIDKLQSLLFQASASSVPAVILSPRLSELAPLQQLSSDANKRTGPSGFEQSGFQKSSTYGGIEPPVGPTSWLLRDLVPPVYVWVGCAKHIGRGGRTRHRSFRSIAASFREQQEQDIHAGGSDEQTYSYYSRLALTQSALETGHHWHMFAVQERLKPLHHSATHAAGLVQGDVSYHYIGSSIASRGRPTSRLMNDVFEEFCADSPTS